MSSGITFSGFNSIDFNTVLEAVMGQERLPYNRLNTQKTTLQTQDSAFATLASKLGAMQSAIESLSGSDSMSTLSANSSDPGVEVSSTTGTVSGTYSVVVQNLARAQVVSSSSTYGSLDDVVGTSGALTFTSGGTTTTVAVTASTTLKQLAKAINSSDGPASASIVQTTPGSYHLVLTGKETGTANAFTVASSLGGGSGAAFIDTDGDGWSGNDAADCVQTALDAQLTVNNLAIVSTTNELSDVVPGVSLTLKKADPATTATIQVKQDTAAAATAINKFVTAYNDIMSFMKTQQTAALEGKASIARDPLLRGFRDGIRQAMMATYPDGGSLTKLASVGIGFDQKGMMTLDKKVFESTMFTSQTDVQGLLAGDDGKSGAFGALDTLINTYTASGGLVAGVRKRLTEQVNRITDRLGDMEEQLALRRATLQKEYAAADTLMSQLTAQSSSLSSIGNQYRLF